MIKFTNNNGTVEPFTIILSQRDYTHLGQISNVAEVKYTSNMNAADELSFIVYKKADDHEEVLWDDIFDLRLIYVKEINEYFQITVSLTDQVYMTKTITATSLCETELSQVYLHDIEINTEADIEREDYDVNWPTVFYRMLPDESDPEYELARNSSFLHRILDKTPAYTIKYVDESLRKVQREFSISDTTVYDFLTGDASEQFNCLFTFDSTDRTISVYDLYTSCLNDECPYYLNENKKYHYGKPESIRYRGDFNDCCPICGSSNINYYGKDTTIFVSTENLTDEVQFETDVDNIKNCFRLVAGDDDMTAAVININPNGSQYIYEFSDEMRKDMPKDLVNAIDSYDAVYNEYNNTHEYTIDETIRTTYNTLCEKYNTLDEISHEEEWEEIPETIVGYPALMQLYYNMIDFYSFLKSSMMPDVVTESMSVDKAVDTLNDSQCPLRLNEIAVTNPDRCSVSTINSAVVNFAKVFVTTGSVKLEIDEDMPNSYTNNIWTGTIKVTSYEDKTVYKDTDEIVLTVTDDLETFIYEKIAKQLAKSKDESIYDVLNIDNYDLFSEAITYYCSTRLTSFYDAIEAALGILTEAGCGTPDEEGESTVTGQVYNNFYVKYYNMLTRCEEELNLRNDEINEIWGNYNADGMLQDEGVIQYILEQIQATQSSLNFKNYLKDTYGETEGVNLYNVYTTYTRENTYSNSNYISDDLDNSELFDNARQFMERAKEELHKSATYQHSIKTNLNNLLNIEAFKPIIDNFELGNWIRVKADETIYRLRLISYSVDFDDLQTLSTEFSDVTITSNGLNDIKSIINQASSMASSYGYVEKQAETGSTAKKEYIDDWVENGLNSANVRIKNNDDEDIKVDETGITARTYDDITEAYGDEQLRITHNVLAFTDDGWATVSTAVGKFEMTDWIVDENGINTNGNDWITSSDKPNGGQERYQTYGVVAKAVLSGKVVSSNIQSSTMISGHIQAPGNETYIDLDDASTTDENKGKKYFLKVKDNFVVQKDGTIRSTLGRFEKDSTHYIDLSGDNDYIHFGNKFTVDKDGNAVIEGTVTATSGKIGAWNVDPSTGYTYSSGALYSGTPGTDMLLAPNGYSASNFAGSSGTKTWEVMLGSGFGIDSSGNCYIKGNIYATSGYIGSYIELCPSDFPNGMRVKTSQYQMWINNEEIGQHTHVNDTWNFFKYKGSNGYLHIDRGDNDEAIYVTHNGQNNYTDFSGTYFVIKNDGYEVSSDRRLKKQIAPLNKDLFKDFMLDLKPMSYLYTEADNSDTKKHLGFIAQDVEQSLKLTNMDSKLLKIDKNGMYSLSYDEFIAPIVTCIQDLYEQIEELKGNE